MRNRFVFLCLTALLLLCLGLSMTACDGGEGDATTPAPTEAPTQPEEDATEVPTDGEVTTETPTETPTEETTEAGTDAPSLMLSVDMDVLDGKKLTDYLTRPSKCDAALVDDEGEGKVLRLSTESIGAVNGGKPTIYFKLAELVEDAGGIMPKTTENPYLVIKVRMGEVWSRNFGIQAGTTIRSIDTNAALISDRMEKHGDWQYLYFDLTGFTGDLTLFYLCFEAGAAKDGESVDIAEIRFVATEAEAIALAGDDTYTLEENRTMEDYVLKVMSFNVQTENGTSVDFALRAEMLRDLLDDRQPDSIGMQEVTVNWIKWMDSVSFNDSYAGVGEGRTPGGEASSIYYRKDKFELVATGTFWLSETPDVVGSALPNANYPRICTWAHLRDKVTGFEYIHVNTHLDHNGNNSSSDGKSIRTNQIRIMLEYLQKLPDVPMVLTGDFNQAKTTSEGVNYAMFKNILGESTFTATTGEKITGNFAEARADAAETVSPDQWASMTKYWDEGGSSYNPAKKPIDYVFYTPADFTAVRYENIHYHRDGIYMSDHLPQYCELQGKLPAADGE